MLASLVLLKNTDGVLPLRADTKVVLAGDGADDVSMQGSHIAQLAIAVSAQCCPLTPWHRACSFSGWHAMWRMDDIMDGAAW